MSYVVYLSSNAEDGILKHKASGAKSTLKKINNLLAELETHPRTGTGKPDYKKRDLRGCWSRKITDAHRLVYLIDDDKMTVLVASTWGHYDDK